MKNSFISQLPFYIVIAVFLTCGEGISQGADSGTSVYSNPIIHADFSDPDVIRVGEDFYLTASSFNAVPALPILHSRDMINWKIINHAIPHKLPLPAFDQPQHGNGVWAPSIRWHDGWFYIFYGDPDFGIYMVKTRDPAGKWEPPHLVKEASGWIDPCPFWDEDGQAYLVHAFAGSRAGVKSVVVLHRMSADGKQLLDDGVLVFDGHEHHTTIEGTKMHKRNGYYYILAPAGGVSTGWQTVLRSRNVYGPYEDKVVLHQGGTAINGPHQGAWVQLANGEDWFFHFQEKQPYGRIVHLQPAKWVNDWLEIGIDQNNDGIGEPVLTHPRPTTGRLYPEDTLATSDEFDQPFLGPQWQWHANPQPTWAFPSAMGFLRLNPVITTDQNLWNAPNLLLQKMPAESFTATTKVIFHPNADGEETGLLVMGRDYAYLGMKMVNGSLQLQQVRCMGADRGKTQTTAGAPIRLSGGEVYLRVEVEKGGICHFSYSTDNKQYLPVGPDFQAREGKWIGAKIGLFSQRKTHQNDGGYADYHWFRIKS